MPSLKRSKQKHAANAAGGSTATLEPDSRTSAQPSSAPSESAASLPEQSTTSSNPPAGSQTPSVANESTFASTGNSVKDSVNGSIKSVRRSWYGGGSWRSKAAPVAQVARESIGVAQGSTTELPAQEARKKPSQAQSASGTSSPAHHLTGSMRRPSKGNPAAASETKLNVTFDGSNASHSSVAGQNDGDSNPQASQPEPSGDATKEDGKEDGKRKQEPQSTGGFASRWTGWWSRPDGQAEQQDAAKQSSATTEAPKDGKQDGKRDDGNAKDSSTPAGESAPADSGEKQEQPRSWFWLWSSTQNAKDSQQSNANSGEGDKPSEPPASSENLQAAEDDTDQTKDSGAPPAQEDPPTKEVPTKASAWAFWSRDKSQSSGADAKGGDDTKKYVGELAVANTPSQSNPEAAQFNEQKEREETQEAPKKKSRLSLIKDSSSRSSAKSTPSQSPSRKPAEESLAAKEDSGPPNHVLPAFTDTYPPMRSQSYWQIIRKYFLGDDKSHPHLSTSSPPRVRKALAIGVHGYFPAAIVSAVIGQPTGTSIRFANSAAAAIRSWAAARGQTDLEIETVALEGEGVITDRVDSLWKLLLNWIDQIRKADFIFVACHSQGVPVAIMLLAKLIAFGCITPSTRVGVCAMAGVNLGPFSGYQSRFLDRSAGELFEFGKPDSKVSQMYTKAVEEALRAGVRILYVGSIDDQLVSLESSTYSTITHPYIYRAVFVNGRTHAPDFLTHLISLTFKLRNLGLPDHGLVRELSPALAGSLYSGEGHSRIYDEEACYSLAIQHALETTSLPHNVSPRISNPGQMLSKADNSNKSDQLPAGSGQAAPAGSNPFFLPWALRGLLEEEKVRKELGDEVQELLRLFENWRPVSKPLKDVRFRLEAVRSKL